MAADDSLEAPLLEADGATSGSGGQVAGGRAKMSRPKVLLVVVSVLADLLMSGVTFGYSGVVGVLTTETKAFASLCQPGETLPCTAQTKSLTAAFTLSSATMCVCGIPVGILLDAVGPRYTTVLASLLFSLGLLSFALAPVLWDVLYYSGFFLLALGGLAISTSTMNFADLFPSVASAIISAQNGAFDASSAVMFLMGKAVTTLGLSFAAVSLAYLSVPLSLIVIAILLFPDQPFGPDSDDSKTQGSEALDDSDEVDAGDSQCNGELWRLYRLKLASIDQSPPASGQAQSTGPSEPGAASKKLPLVAPPPALYNSDVSTQLKSGVYWVLLVVSAYLVMRKNFFIGSINQQLAFAIDAHPGTIADPGATQALYIDLFNYIMPLGGLSSIPLSAYVMVQYGMTPAFVTIGVLSCLLTCLQIAAPSLPLTVQIFCFVLYAVTRGFIFGTLAAFMGQIFGFRNFGTLVGINRFACGVVTVIQYPLISLSDDQFGGDYRPVLGGFLVIEFLIAVLLPLYLWKHVYYGYFFCPAKPVEGLETE